MSDKICHLCNTHYNDGPYFKEQPAHTPEQCLGILQFRSMEQERQLFETQKNIERALKEYSVKE